MSDLVDISFIIIAIAIIGFIAKDSFYLSRRSNLPYELRDESEKLFSNITIGLFIISVCWMLIVSFILPIPDLANALVRPIFDQMVKLANAGIISSQSVDESIKNVIIWGNFLSVASIFFIVLIFVSTIAGIIAMYMDKRGILVTPKDGSENKKFRRIIKESDDYFYFQSLNNFRQWEAIPKAEVSRIKNINISEESIVNKWIADNCSKFFEKHAKIKYYLGDDKRRRNIIVGLLLVILFITLVVPSVNQNVITRIGFIVIFVPVIILLLIDTALYKYTEDEI
jgi:hypothetical protein